MSLDWHTISVSKLVCELTIWLAKWSKCSPCAPIQPCCCPRLWQEQQEFPKNTVATWIMQYFYIYICVGVQYSNLAFFIQLTALIPNDHFKITRLFFGCGFLFSDMLFHKAEKKQKVKSSKLIRCWGWWKASLWRLEKGILGPVLKKLA